MLSEQIGSFKCGPSGKGINPEGKQTVFYKSCLSTGLPQSGKNIWKMNFFPGQGKVGEFFGLPGKFRKDLESQGKVREFENKWQWQAVFRKFIYSVQEGKGCTFS